MSRSVELSLVDSTIAASVLAAEVRKHCRDGIGTACCSSSTQKSEVASSINCGKLILSAFRLFCSWNSKLRLQLRALWL